MAKGLKFIEKHVQPDGGIYVPGTWGMRLEDIVVATADGPMPVNTSDHGLISV